MKVHARAGSPGLSFSTTGITAALMLVSSETTHLEFEGKILSLPFVNLWRHRQSQRGETLPETYVIFRDDGPTTHPTIVICCYNGVSVFCVGLACTEEFPASNILKNPQAISTLREHPL